MPVAGSWVGPTGLATQTRCVETVFDEPLCGLKARTSAYYFVNSYIVRNKNKYANLFDIEISIWARCLTTNDITNSVNVCAQKPDSSGRH